MSTIEMLVDKFVDFALVVVSEHGIFIGFLAILGLFSIISGIGNKAFNAFKYLFMIFIAIPAILVVGLFNKSERKARLKELGEIKAHLKNNPHKLKRILYFVLLCIFILIIASIFYWVLMRFVFPFYELNEYTKMIMENYTNNLPK